MLIMGLRRVNADALCWTYLLYISERHCSKIVSFGVCTNKHIVTHNACYVLHLGFSILIFTSLPCCPLAS